MFRPIGMDENDQDEMQSYETTQGPGDYRIRVRPNGDNCARRIRREVEFTIL